MTSRTLAVQALAVAPDSVPLLYDTAMAAERLNQVAVMEKQLRKIIELKPDYAHAYNALGYSLADRNLRLPEALQLIEKARELAPDDAFILDSLGWVYFRLGDLKLARESLQLPIQRAPDAEVAVHLAEVLWTIGDQDSCTQASARSSRQGAEQPIAEIDRDAAADRLVSAMRVDISRRTAF